MAAINANDKPEPYSLEELNERIDEAERQFESGEVIDGHDVHKQMRRHLQRNAAVSKRNFYLRNYGEQNGTPNFVCGNLKLNNHG